MVFLGRAEENVTRTLDRNDPWVRRSYAQGAIVRGSRSALLIVDLQYAFTHSDSPLGVAKPKEQAVVNTARVADAATTSRPSFRDGRFRGVRATVVDADAFCSGFRTLVPEVCVGDHGADAHQANLRDVHRRYAEVTMADDMIDYFGQVDASNDPRSA